MVGGAWELIQFCCMQNNHKIIIVKKKAPLLTLQINRWSFLGCFTTELLQCNKIENKMLLLTLL